MQLSQAARKKLTILSESKAYRDAYVGSHVRSGIAYQIQALREKLQLSQEEFAKKIGMKQSAVSRLENTEYGKVTVQTLLDIALALDVALLIRFCPYPEFLVAAAKISPEELMVEDIHESMMALE